MSQNFDFGQPLIAEMISAIEADLRQVVSGLDSGAADEMHRMVAYHLGWTDGGDTLRGKRLRPLFALLACASAGGSWQAAIPAASSVELIHNFSLIHDDIEDQSELRRGRPTVWKRWGMAQAVNTGDAVFVLARLASRRLEERGVPPATVIDVQGRIDSACLSLTIGQHLDLAFEHLDHVSADQYLEMIAGKTASLLAAATVVGARIAGASRVRVRAYHDFGYHLGMSFQIQDDLLGIWGDPDITGKSAGDDLRARKKTLPVILGLVKSARFRQSWADRLADDPAEAGLQEALNQAGVADDVRRHAEKHTNLALQALQTASPVGEAAGHLSELAHFLLNRQA
jgi:geranylgeranyl diphosphate synthase, type I